MEFENVNGGHDLLEKEVNAERVAAWKQGRRGFHWSMLACGV